MNTVDVAEGLNILLAGVRLLKSVGVTVSEIKEIIDRPGDIDVEVLREKLLIRQQSIESRIENEE
jgi:DNA-binding transcriptional MerR regulator